MMKKVHSFEVLMELLARNIKGLIDSHAKVRDDFKQMDIQYTNYANSLGFHPRTVRDIAPIGQDVDRLVLFFEGILESLVKKDEHLNKGEFAQEASFGLGLYLELDFDSQEFLAKEKELRGSVFSSGQVDESLKMNFQARNKVRESRYKDGSFRKIVKRVKSYNVDRRDIRGALYWDLFFKKWIAGTRIKVFNMLPENYLSSVHIDSLSGDKLHVKPVVLNTTLLTAHIMYLLFNDTKIVTAKPMSEEALRKLLTREKRGVMGSRLYRHYLRQHFVMASERLLWERAFKICHNHRVVERGYSLEELLLFFRRVDLALVLEDKLSFTKLETAYQNIIEPIQDLDTTRHETKVEHNPYQGSKIRDLLGRVVDDLPLDMRLS